MANRLQHYLRKSSTNVRKYQPVRCPLNWEPNLGPAAQSPSPAAPERAYQENSGAQREPAFKPLMLL